MRDLLQHLIAICNAMSYAHSRGVIHRDLKPDNVMLGEFGETLVVDWGLAKVVGRGEVDETDSNEGTIQLPSDPEATMAGAVVGTLAYMSPEQARGESETLTAATDIYSLGGILYCILTGQPPLVAGDKDRASTAELLQRARAAKFPRPRSIQPHTPSPLQAVCEKALSTEPADRYSKAEDLANDLKRFLADEPVAVWAEPITVRAKRWTRRHQTAAAVIIASSLLIAAGLLGLTTILSGKNSQLADANQLLADSNARERTARETAERNEKEATALREQERSLREIAETKSEEAEANLYASQMNLAYSHITESRMQAARDLLERWAVKPGEVDRRGVEWHCLWRMCNLPIRRFDYFVFRPFVGFHEGNLVNAGPDGVEIRNWRDNKVLQTFEVKGCRIFDIARDGLIACGGASTNIQLLDLRSGKVTATLEGHTKPVMCVKFDGSGKRLISSSFDKTARIWDVTAPESMPIVYEDAHGKVCALSRDGTVGLISISDGSSHPYVQLIDVTAGKVLHVLKKEDASAFPFTAAFDDADSRVAVAYDDGLILIYDVSSAAIIRKIQANSSLVHSLVFSHQSDQLITGHNDGQVRSWDIERGLESRRYRSDGSVYAVAESPNGIVAGSGFETSLWQPSVPTVIRRIRVPFVPPAAVNPVNSTLLGYEGLDRPRITSVRADSIVFGEHPVTSDIASQNFWAFECSSDGKSGYFLGRDDHVREVNFQTGHTIQEVPVESDSFHMAIAPDGRFVVTAGKSGLVTVTNLGAKDSNVNPLQLDPLRGQEIQKLSISPCGDWIAAVGRKGQLIIWETDQWTVVRSFKTRDYMTTCDLRFHPVDRRIAIEIPNVGIRIFAFETDKKHIELKVRGLVNFEFTHDGSRVVAICDDSIRIWDSVSGVELFAATEDMLLHGSTFDGSGNIRIKKPTMFRMPMDDRFLFYTNDWHVLDLRPLAPALRLEREAMGYVTHLSQKFPSRADLLLAVESDNDIPEDLRNAAFCMIGDGE